MDLPKLGMSVRPRTVTGVAAIPTTSRTRLARELHDGVGQSLTGLLVEIRVALDRGEAGRDDLLIIEREAQRALQAVRALAYGVRQRPAANLLADARRYGDRLLTATGGVLHWVDERAGVRLGHAVARRLAWSIRESITNAVRHGGAGLVEVRLSESGGRVRVSVRDDGIGFLPNEVWTTPDGRGLGLLGNAERMAEVGGIFEIQSQPGEGTVILLEAPCHLRRPIITQSLATVELMLGSPQEPKVAVAGL